MMKSDIQAYQKFENLIPELREHPYNGTGHPSSGDNIFYKVRDANHIVLIDSSKNEPKRKEAKHFVLRKKAQGTVQFHENAIRFHGIVLLTCWRN